MRKREVDGTRYAPQLEAELDNNQERIVDELLTPHPQMPEFKGSAGHKICCSVPAHEPDAQPVQARGHIVWNRAYEFQPRGPSYLDPVSDPGALTHAR